jgi:hypothetical protein
MEVVGRTVGVGFKSESNLRTDGSISIAEWDFYFSRTDNMDFRVVPFSMVMIADVDGNIWRYQCIRKKTLSIWFSL